MLSDLAEHRGEDTAYGVLLATGVGAPCLEASGETLAVPSSRSLSPESPRAHDVCFDRERWLKEILNIARAAEAQRLAPWEESARGFVRGA